MKKKTSLTISVFCHLFLIASILIGTKRICNAQTPTNKLQFINDEQTFEAVPFRFISNLIIIPMQINGSDTLRFILDSGVRTTIITELNANDSLELNYAQKTKISGLGRGKPLEALHSYGNTFTIKSIKGEYQSCYILLDNIFHLSSRLGLEVNGLIGYDLLKDFVIEINYVKNLLYFYSPDNYRHKKKRRDVEYPLFIEGNKPYINMHLTMHNGVEVPVKMLVDTGGSMALWLSTASDELITLPETNIDAFLGRGLNGDITGKIGRIQKLNVGKFELESPVTSFPDSASVAAVIRSDSRNGSIGSEVLRRFHVVLDYPHNKVIMRPNNDFHETFTYNMSGIEFHTPIPGFPVYEITEVREESPAALAGIKVGDQIIEINHKHAVDLTFNEISATFHSKKGKTLRMKLLRDGKEVVTKFKLVNEL